MPLPTRARLQGAARSESLNRCSTRCHLGETWRNGFAQASHKRFRYFSAEQEWPFSARAQDIALSRNWIMSGSAYIIPPWPSAEYMA
jgi:hypothetical protein